MVVTLGAGVITPGRAEAADTIVLVDNLQPSWTAPGGKGVYSAYYGPPYYTAGPVSPGITALYDGREAGIIKAGLTVDPISGIYKDEGLFGFVPNITIDSFAAGTLSYDVQNQYGENPVWMTTEIDTGVVGDRTDNTKYQFVPTTNPAGWHTVNAAAGLWQKWNDNQGDVTGNPLISLSAVAAAHTGCNVIRTYLRLGMGDSYHGIAGLGTVAWVDKATIGTVTYDFVVPTYWYVAKTGLDTNEGTLASPFLTIQAAVTAASSGNTINVAAGTYYEEVSITGKNNVTLTRTGEGSTIIAPVRVYASNNSGISLYNSNNITIQNLTIDGFANAALPIGVAHFKDGIHFGNNASPEANIGGSNCIFTHVTISNVDRRGISIFPETLTNNEISYCTINNVTGVNNGQGYGQGIQFSGSGKVEHCTISNVTGAILGNCNVVGGTLSIEDNVITALTGLTATPFDIGINFWCKQSNVITVKNNSITANVANNNGIYVVRGGDGSEISNNTINLTGDGGAGIETGWENTWGFPVHHNTITMGKGGAGIVITGAGSDADPMLVYNNTLTNVGGDDSFTNNYIGYSLREVGLLLSGHKYTSRTGDASYPFNGSVYNNSINGFKDGIVLASEAYNAGGYNDVEIKLSNKNSITNFETAARYGYISNTTPYPFTEIASTDANYAQQNLSMNYWGSASPVFNDIKVNFKPWYVDAGMTTLVSSAKAITAFGILTPAVTGVITGTNIAVTVPYGTAVDGLVATFTTTGSSVNIGGTGQTSGTTANNFSNPVTYTVVAADTTTQNYTVTVTVALNPARAITSFTIPAQVGTTTIDESAHTVALTMPYGTNRNGLVATFTTTGSSVKVGDTVQVSGSTPNNFTSAVTYKVIAADLSEQAYVVTASIATAITVTSPNGMESWAAGSTQPVTWTYSNLSAGETYVRIYLVKGGGTPVQIGYAPRGASGAGIYNWTIPAAQTGGTDYRIKVCGYTNQSVSDTSDADFTISGTLPPSITVTSPNGMESWAAGSTHPVTWTYSNLSAGETYVRIYLVKGGGTPVQIGYAPRGAPGAGTYNWTIPAAQTSGDDYRIKVCGYTNQSVSDTSDAYFFIGP